MTALHPLALEQAQRRAWERQADVIMDRMAHGAGLNEINAANPYPQQVIAIVQRRIDEAQEARVRAAKEVKA